MLISTNLNIFKFNHTKKNVHLPLKSCDNARKIQLESAARSRVGGGLVSSFEILNCKGENDRSGTSYLKEFWH